MVPSILEDISRNVADRQYFKGAIDEVRVFDTVLTNDQIQRMVYQEIQENSGNVQGSVIGKDVVDIATDTKVSWNDLDCLLSNDRYSQ